MKVAIVALGTRGNIQVGLAVGKRLRQAGHEVVLIAPDNFRKIAADYGFEVRTVSVDTMLVSRTAFHRTGSQLLAGRAMVSALQQFSTFEQVWNVFPRDADVVLAHTTISMPHALPIAEKLGIPVVGYAADPNILPTREFPFSSMPMPVSLSRIPGFNRFSYTLFQHLGWTRLAEGMNRLRTQVLGLSSLSERRYYAAMQQTTLIYGFSEHLQPKPEDWPRTAHVVGFIFLETESSDWQPPAGLLDFLDRSPKPVCIGFSSMNPKEHGGKDVELLVQAARKSGQRAVILTGWTAGAEAGTRGDLFLVDSVPHDWIFPRVTAAVHHGGAGSTSSALRAGLPSVIVPFAFDQPFWARRVQARNAGLTIPKRQLTVERLATAIDRVVQDETLRNNAWSLGAKIAAEDGTGRAVELIECAAIPSVSTAATVA